MCIQKIVVVVCVYNTVGMNGLGNLVQNGQASDNIQSEGEGFF